MTKPETESDSENVLLLKETDKEVIKKTSKDSLSENHSEKDVSLIDKKQNSKDLNSFNDYGFNENIIKAVEEKGYKEPTPIQKAAFPELMLGRDLLGQAQTGTGKTAAFALPIIERISEKKGPPQVLVLTPTRELAIQVADSFKSYALKTNKVKVTCIYGGSDFREQVYILKKGVEIVVGTPGRVMDHMRQGTLTTSNLECLVLDEADEMLRMGFIDDIEWILEKLPLNRQMIFFSATMPREIRKLSQRYLKNPAEITINSKSKEANLISQKYIMVQNSYKLNALKRVLQVNTNGAVIIFARTKAITLRLSESLEMQGHNVAVLNGDVPQNLRERTIDRLKQGNIDILVATDVAARGLDVERIGLVINYDMPFDSEAYIHRIGRTGRAGRKGDAILFISPRERSFLNNLQKSIGKQLEKMDIPTNKIINSKRIENLKLELNEIANNHLISDNETNLIEEVINFLKNEKNIDTRKIAESALALAIKNNSLIINEDDSWISQNNNRKYNDDRSYKHNKRKSMSERHRSDSNKECFRIEVGHRDRIKPGNIVGAIANEAGINGKMIGRIQIFENYSLVDLPKGMPSNIFQSLKHVRIMNKELNINRY